MVILPVTLYKASDITSNPILICTQGHLTIPLSKCIHHSASAMVVGRTAWVAGSASFLPWDSRAHSTFRVPCSRGDPWCSIPGPRGLLRQPTPSFPAMRMSLDVSLQSSFQPQRPSQAEGSCTMPSVHVHLEGEEELSRWRLGLLKKFKLRLVVLGA